MSRSLTRRDLRLHRPETKGRLRREREVVVTRDGKPVAKLSAFVPDEERRPPFSPEDHLAWLGRTWRGKEPGPSTDGLLAKDRDG